MRTGGTTTRRTYFLRYKIEFRRKRKHSSKSCVVSWCTNSPTTDGLWSHSAIRVLPHSRRSFTDSTYQGMTAPSCRTRRTYQPTGSRGVVWEDCGVMGISLDASWRHFLIALPPCLLFVFAVQKLSAAYGARVVKEGGIVCERRT